MPNIPTNELLDETSCYTCLGISLADSLKLALLDRIAGNGGVKVYRALLTQSGTNAPVATVLENTLGGTLVWSYIVTGRYEATLAGAFPSSKVFPTITNINNSRANGMAVRRDSDDVLTVETGIIGDANEDDTLSSTPIEILVYP